MTSVTEALSLATRCFGAPRHVKPGYTGVTFELGFGGGDLAHWREHPNVASLHHSVEFTRLGRGKLTFDLVRVGHETWSIRQVKYGLPAYDPRSKQRIASCARQLFRHRGP